MRWPSILLQMIKSKTFSDHSFSFFFSGYCTLLIEFRMHCTFLFGRWRAVIFWCRFRIFFLKCLYCIRLPVHYSTNRRGFLLATTCTSLQIKFSSRLGQHHSVDGENIAQPIDVDGRPVEHDLIHSVRTRFLGPSLHCWTLCYGRQTSKTFWCRRFVDKQRVVRSELAGMLSPPVDVGLMFMTSFVWLLSCFLILVKQTVKHYHLEVLNG